MSIDTYIWVKQLKGSAGKSKKQRLVLNGLGLRRIGDEKKLKDTPAIRGMIEKIQHMLEVQVRVGCINLSGARSRRIVNK